MTWRLLSEAPAAAAFSRRRHGANHSDQCGSRALFYYELTDQETPKLQGWNLLASVLLPLAARVPRRRFYSAARARQASSTLEQSHDSPVAAHRHLEHNWYASRRAITISPAAEK